MAAARKIQADSPSDINKNNPMLLKDKAWYSLQHIVCVYTSSYKWVLLCNHKPGAGKYIKLEHCSYVCERCEKGVAVHAEVVAASRAESKSECYTYQLLKKIL